MPLVVYSGVGEITTKGLIDSGASCSFLDIEFCKNNQVSLSEKTSPYNLTVIDGRPILSGKVLHETQPLRISLGDHSENFTFDVVSLGSIPIVLGID